MFFVEIEEIMDENPDLKMQVFRRLSTGGGSVRSTNSQARLVTLLHVLHHLYELAKLNATKILNKFERFAPKLNTSRYVFTHSKCFCKEKWFYKTWF